MKLTKEAINDVGMFLATYNIFHPGMVGEDQFRVQLAVSTPNRKVSGTGNIANGSIAGNQTIYTKLEGRFSYMTVMPKNTHIQIVLTGYPDVTWPPLGGVGPVMQHNAELLMVLNDDWKTGTANYRYMTSNGTWKEMEDIPVNIADSKVLTK